MVELTSVQVELVANQDHWIANLGNWQRRNLSRLDAILTEFGYERAGRVRWDVNAAGDSFLIRVPAFDLDGAFDAAPVTVAVMDREMFGAMAGVAELAATPAQGVA